MARQKKHQIVGTINHGSGCNVDITLNPEDLQFSAKVIDGVVFTSSTAAEVRKLAVEYLDKNSKINWVKVIQISEQKPFVSSDDFFIGIEIDRFYLGRAADGELRKLQWDAYDEWFGAVQNDMGRIKYSSTFYGFHEGSNNPKDGIKLPHSTGRANERVHYVEFSEGAWTGLEQIREGISQLKIRLRETIGSEAGMKRLVELGAKSLLLLESPPSEPALIENRNS